MCVCFNTLCIGKILCKFHICSIASMKYCIRFFGNSSRAEQGTVRQHIAVKVIGNIVTVEYNKSVVGVILETAVRCVGQVACGVVGVGFRGNHTVIRKVLHSSRCYAVQAIISITQFGRICKYLFFDNIRQIVIGILKAC